MVKQKMKYPYCNQKLKQFKTKTLVIEGRRWNWLKNEKWNCDSDWEWGNGYEPATVHTPHGCWSFELRALWLGFCSAEMTIFVKSKPYFWFTCVAFINEADNTSYYVVLNNWKKSEIKYVLFSIFLFRLNKFFVFINNIKF